MSPHLPRYNNTQINQNGKPLTDEISFFLFRSFIMNFCKHLFRICNQVHFYNVQLLFLQQLHKKKLISFLIPNHISLLFAMHNCPLCPNSIRIVAKEYSFSFQTAKECSSYNCCKENNFEFEIENSSSLQIAKEHS